MISRLGLAALALAVSCLGLVVGPGLGVASAAEPVGTDLLGGGVPGPIPPLPLPGNPPLPDHDPFYRAPDSLSGYKPGELIRSRQVTVLGLTSLTGSVLARQLLFRSTDVGGKPIAAVTTLIQPTLPVTGTHKLVSYQSAEDSFTTGCAPSYALRTNSGLLQPAENSWIAAVLANGWTVSIPDHEGPRSEFAVGPVEGQVTLDSIRAAVKFGPADLDGARTPVALMGYSGGSSPTLWANALSPKYAPELNLVGAAAGGVVADVGDIVRAHPGPPIFGGVFAFPVALDRAYSDVDLNSLITDRGKELAERIGRDANGCFGILTAAPLDSVQTDTRYSDIDSFLGAPSLAKALARTNLVSGPRLSVPTLLVQGIQDELVPVGQVDDLVSANCHSAASINYQRIPGEHATTLAPYLAASLAFFRDRFAGSPSQSNCT